MISKYVEKCKKGERKNTFSVEFITQVIQDVVQYRQLGGSQDDIDYTIQKDYGIKNPLEFRRYATFLDKMGLIEVVCDSKTTLEKIARARNQQLIQQKINVKQRNLINAEANTEAFRKLIVDAVKEFPYTKYTRTRKVSKKCLKTLNKGIFIVADEHFKGQMDVKGLNQLYDCIEDDIKANKGKNVEIGYLGDGIDGLIHKGSLASNDGAINPSITYVNILIERVNRIKQVSRIRFVNRSNHTQTRALGTNRNELAKEDLALTIANTLKWGLRPDIDLVCNDIIRFVEQGFQVALLHGHQKYASSREHMNNYGNEQYNFVPDLTIMGHYHTFKINEYGKNKGLVVAPTAKQFNGDFEEAEGFVSYGQYLTLNFIDNMPQFTVRRIK